MYAQVQQQQVIPGEFPDPSVIRVGATFYAAGSSNDWGPIYPIYSSPDLQDWTPSGYVFQEQPDWTVSSYWAPELFYQDSTFYCYYTAKRTDGTSLLGVATTKDISGGFTDHGQLLEWGSEAIDAFVVRDNGKLYLTWKAYGLDQDTLIQLLGAQLSDDGLTVTGDAFTLLTADTDTWEKGGIEGQAIFRHGDYLYLLYSGNACCGGGCDYQVGVARAAGMEGRWEKFTQNPLLTGNDRWKCPGHGTTVQVYADWFYLYHAYPAEGFPYLGRTALLSELVWDEASGWPQFKPAGDQDASTLLPANFYDDFSGTQLSDHWRYDVASYSFTADLDTGLLLTEQDRSTDNQSGAMLGINPESANFTMSTEITGYNDALKGLVLYATKDNSLGFGVRGDSLILWKVEDGQFEELAVQERNYHGSVRLRGTVRDAHLAEFQYSEDGENWQPIFNETDNTATVTGDHLAWWSWGVKAGVLVKGTTGAADRQGAFSFFGVEYD